METAVPPSRDVGNDAPPSARGAGRVIPDSQLLLWSCVVGLVGGLLAIVYYFMLSGAIYLVWTRLIGFDWRNLPLTAGFYPNVLLVTTIGGLCVGLVLKYIGKPGEIAAVVNNIHMERGRIDTQQTPSMVVASLVSIAAGGSAGPEAPLVQILGSCGSWIGDRLKLRGDLVRTLTFCGMGTALGAFFGAPLGGALFALEIPHRRGLEYFEALVPTIVATLIGFFVFRAAVGFEGPIYHLQALKKISLAATGAGVIFGLLGGALGMVFIVVFGLFERLLHPLRHRTVLLATAGGLCIGLIAQVTPATLFWSELQLVGFLNAGPALVGHFGLRLGIAVLVWIALWKMIAISLTLHSGFRGGFIFPLFFIGACVGMAITLAFPALPAPIVILSMMAAVNVAVTKTPISTAVILTTISGTSYMPALVGASFASFLLTTRVGLIRTQRSRELGSN